MDCYKFTLTEYDYPSKSSKDIICDFITKVHKELGKQINSNSFAVMFHENDEFPKTYYVKTLDEELLNYLIIAYDAEDSNYPDFFSATPSYEVIGNQDFFN